MNTLLLDKNWDLTLDNAGNIAVATEEYAIAQNCANAIRLFTGEAYFNLSRGIPHFDIELGQNSEPARAVLSNRIRQACMNVEGVASCEVVLEFNEKTRTYGGEVNITVTNGATVNIEL